MYLLFKIVTLQFLCSYTNTSQDQAPIYIQNPADLWKKAKIYNFYPNTQLLSETWSLKKAVLEPKRFEIWSQSQCL